MGEPSNSDRYIDQIARLWRSLGPGQWEPVIEWPRGFTEADIGNLHATVNSLLKRMVMGPDEEGNRLRELKYAGANEAVIAWIMCQCHDQESD